MNSAQTAARPATGSPMAVVTASLPQSGQFTFYREGVLLRLMPSVARSDQISVQMRRLDKPAVFTVSRAGC